MYYGLMVALSDDWNRRFNFIAPENDVMQITQAEEIARPEAGSAQLSGGKLKVAVLGATGMVGQQLIRLLAEHPWFEVAVVAASANSAGKPYAEAVRGRWTMESRIPSGIATMNVWNVQAV